MKPVIVTKELANVGLAVMRGKDWSYSNQDGEPGNKGIISNPVDEYGWVKVEWENGDEIHYRVGNESKYDLYAYIPGFYDKKVPEVLTQTNCRTGLVLELGPYPTELARSECTKLDQLVVRNYNSSGVNLWGGGGLYFSYNNFVISKGQTVKPEKPKIYKFSVGDGVYLKHYNNWTDRSGILRGVNYVVAEVSDRIMKLAGKPDWQNQDDFMSQDEWLSSQKVDLAKIRENVQAISENSKPNKNGTNTSEPELYKVRRPISTIQGPKGRFRA